MKWPNFIHLNFYRVHVLYFIFTILLSSFIVYGSGVDGNSNDAEARFRLRYIDALFLCASAMTNTGLNTVNLSSITAFQQAVLFILMLLGNVTVVSIATVLIRRHYMQKNMQEFVEQSKAGQEVVNDIDEEELGKNHNTTRKKPQKTDSMLRRRRGPAISDSEDKSTPSRFQHHETGHGGMPYPWEWSIARKLGSILGAPADLNQNTSHHYLSFKPSLDHKGRFHSLNEREHEELGGVEYRALGALLWLVPLYICFWLAIAMIILIPWSYKPDVVAILQGPQPGRLNPGWWASFLAVSGYCNVGLDLLDQNMIPFQPFCLVLIVIMVIKLAGNTFFPVFLRMVIWAATKMLPKTSRLHHSLAFLLQHPRRCFLLLFPSINTWYLAAVQASLHLGLWIFWFLLQIDYPTVWSIPSGQRTIAGLFQALGVRTAGMYIIQMSQISPSLLVLYTGAMYISGLPILISIRSTNIYEERSLGLQDSPPPDSSQKSEKSYIGTHLQKQLANDAWWLFFAFLLITIIERTALAIPSPGFDLYAVFFDVVSAFGTVGLSTGVPYDTYAFCGAWHTLSKLVLIAVMLRGRHRGLPMAIDRAVLLPGQELMERMDREYNGGDGKKIGREKEEVREDEGGERAENEEMGQDPEQDAATAEKVHQEKSQQAMASTA